MTWRDDPITEKQKQYIEDIQEFSGYTLLPFDGTTKGEAADYISKYAELLHDNINGRMFGY